ncbi:MAG: ABC transporter ATP-binding protein, partial [Pedosphaera sp.]|nr:ABC transporter ATP-binding protein [Pedosphaera sp.]
HNLTRVFHVGDSEVRAVNGLTLALETGALASIIGPSGSGKSTLLALLGGLDTPTAGTITVDDRPLHSLNADELAAYRRTSVGFIFQDFFLLSHLTALENVETPLKLAGMPRAQRRDRARALIEQVGLAARADHHPRQLSGGERQRVAIARALANHPRLLLADEPTGNLDVHTGRQIADLLVQLNAEQGITMLMVTHNMEVARRTPLQLRMTDGRLDPIAA